MQTGFKKVNVQVLERFFVNKYVDEMLSGREKLNYYWFDNLYSKSIKLYKRGQVKMADIYWQKARMQFELLKENTPLKILVSSTSLPKESFFLFKNGKYDEAKNVIDENISLSIGLIESGKYFLLVAILQQHLNLIRLYLFQRNQEAALSLATETIIYLMTGRALKGNLKEEYLQLLKEELGEYYNGLILQYINQVFLEVVESLFDQYDLENRFSSAFMIFYKETFKEVNYLKSGIDANDESFEFIKLFSLLSISESSFVGSSLLFLKENLRLSGLQRKVLSNTVMKVIQLQAANISMR